MATCAAFKAITGTVWALLNAPDYILQSTLKIHLYYSLFNIFIFIEKRKEPTCRLNEVFAAIFALPKRVSHWLLCCAAYVVQTSKMTPVDIGCVSGANNIHHISLSRDIVVAANVFCTI